VNPPPPSAVNPDLPAEFDVLLQRALAKERQRRPSAADVAATLWDLRGHYSGVHGFTADPLISDPERETFVGRERELERLEEILRQAEARMGKVVFVTGEPGIGKTVPGRTHAALGRLLASAGDAASAENAYAESGRIIQAIASETQDERLRNTFLSSKAVTQVLERITNK
jgi:type II secretory pathway predicted ATPase ExeA